MNKAIFTLAAAGAVALNGCISLADKGSQAMAEQDNTAVQNTGKTIQKGVKPIQEAKNDVIDAVKDAVD